MSRPMDDDLSLDEADVFIIEDHKRSSNEFISFEKINKLWMIFNSGILLPDSLKRNPYTKPTLIAFMIALLILPIRIYLFLLFFGILMGLILGVNDGISSNYQHLKNICEERFAAAKLDDFDGTASMITNLTLSNSQKIHRALNAFLDRLVSSLIDPWFMPQNKSGQREFQSCIRCTLDQCILTLREMFAKLGHDSVTLLLYGYTNALLIHIQEFKMLIKLGNSEADFLKSSLSRRTWYSNSQSEALHFRQLISIILKRLLPRPEGRSIVVNSLLKDLLSSGALWNAMDRLCDPDFINMKIVEALTEKYVSEVPQGWNIVVVKILQAKSTSDESKLDGLHCFVHIAGRKVRTRKLHAGKDAIWNETFQFKISDSMLRKIITHIQLTDSHGNAIGYSKISPLPRVNLNESSPQWVKFPDTEVLIDSYIISSAVKNNKNEYFNQVFDTDPQSDIAENITLEELLADNQLFMEFHEYLNEFEAPAYLQFIMNLDALRQFTAMEIGVDPSQPAAIDNYFRSAPLNSIQKEQLKVIKLDTADLFRNHFLPGTNSKYLISLNSDLYALVERNLKNSDKLDELGYFSGDKIGPNIFEQVYLWILSILREVYFPKFLVSERLAYFKQRSQQQVVVENNRTCSLDKDDYIKFEENTRLWESLGILKENLALIEDKINGFGGPSEEIEALLETKSTLEKEIEGLTELISQDTLWIDLTDCHIKIYSSLQKNDSTISLWSSDPLYDIEVIKSGEVSNIVTKSLSNIKSMHGKLKQNFPKLSHMIVPDDTEGLEHHFELLISDEFVKQSPILREFLTLDTGVDNHSLKPGQIVEAVVGRNVKNALQSTASILSAGVISAPSGKKHLRVYETRDYHSSSDVRTSSEQLNSNAILERSRSATSLSYLTEEKTTSVLKTSISMPSTPIKRPISETQRDTSISIFKIDEFSDSEIDMLMESVYEIITETFDLRESNQWIRRKVLALSKQLLKQAYGDTLAKAIPKIINNMLTEDSILRHIEMLTNILWPNGVFIKEVPPLFRSADQQLATQIEARTLLLNTVPDSLNKLTGHFNAVNGVNRIFNILQRKEFNKMLFISAMDITIKLLFTEI